MENDFMIEIINILKHSFEEEIFFKYNGYARDFLSFYVTGHCISFVTILKELFNDEVEIFDDFSCPDNIGHFIIKYNNHFYDARGCIDYLIFNHNNQFSLCNKSYFPYIFENYHNTSEHDNEIMEDLIIIGKNALKEINNKNLLY